MTLPAQKKKKGSRIKPVTVKVGVLPNKELSSVPKGKKWQKLAEEKRVEVIELKRTISPAEVESRIKQGFSHLPLTNWEYLEVNGGHLIKANTQNQGGEIVDRRGALYIREKHECQVSFHGIQ